MIEDECPSCGKDDALRQCAACGEMLCGDCLEERDLSVVPNRTDRGTARAGIRRIELCPNCREDESRAALAGQMRAQPSSPNT